MDAKRQEPAPRRAARRPVPGAVEPEHALGIHRRGIQRARIRDERGDGVRAVDLTHVGPGLPALVAQDTSARILVGRILQPRSAAPQPRHGGVQGTVMDGEPGHGVGVPRRAAVGPGAPVESIYVPARRRALLPGGRVEAAIVGRKGADHHRRIARSPMVRQHGCRLRVDPEPGRPVIAVAAAGRTMLQRQVEPAPAPWVEPRDDVTEHGRRRGGRVDPRRNREVARCQIPRRRDLEPAGTGQPRARSPEGGIRGCPEAHVPLDHGVAPLPRAVSPINRQAPRTDRTNVASHGDLPRDALTGIGGVAPVQSTPGLSVNRTILSRPAMIVPLRRRPRAARR